MDEDLHGIDEMVENKSHKNKKAKKNGKNYKSDEHQITIEQVKKDPFVVEYVTHADQHSENIGLTEHGFRHSSLVSNIAGNVLKRMDYPAREIELARIAGFLHDMGNVVSRYDHGQIGSTLSENILRNMGMPPSEIACIIGAIGNHEEEHGNPVNNVSAALILADKSDVHRTRVRNVDVATFDIHDRVNHAVVNSFVNVDEKKKTVSLELTIETDKCPVVDYFEIFLTRMIMCRRAATFLDATFKLIVNETILL